jgi:hypothetical protein
MERLARIQAPELDSRPPRKPGYRLLVLPPGASFSVSKSKGSGVFPNMSIRMHRSKSPRQTGALQIASLKPFIEKSAFGPLVSGL